MWKYTTVLSFCGAQPQARLVTIATITQAAKYHTAGVPTPSPRSVSNRAASKAGLSSHLLSHLPSTAGEWSSPEVCLSPPIVLPGWGLLPYRNYLFCLRSSWVYVILDLTWLGYPFHTHHWLGKVDLSTSWLSSYTTKTAPQFPPGPQAGFSQASPSTPLLLCFSPSTWAWNPIAGRLILPGGTARVSGFQEEEGGEVLLSGTLSYSGWGHKAAERPHRPPLMGTKGSEVPPPHVNACSTSLSCELRYYYCPGWVVQLVRASSQYAKVRVWPLVRAHTRINRRMHK